jgi:hypothetical protein
VAGPRPSQRDAEQAEQDFIAHAVRTTIPVIVESYDDVRNVATVRLRRNPIDDQGRVFVAPPLRDLPVAWPRGGGWIGFRGELAPGDLCLLLVSDRELAPQLLGPNGQPVSGTSRRMHELSDGIVVPLGLSVPGATIAPAAGRPLIGREDGSVGIRFSLAELELEATTTIKAGAGAVLGAARTTDLVGADAVMTAHLTAAQVVLAGAATLLGLAVPPPATDFGVITGGSTKVKIE